MTALLAGHPATAAEPPVPTLSVVATGEVSDGPTVAPVSTGIVSEGPTDAEAAAARRAETAVSTTDLSLPSMGPSRVDGSPVRPGTRTMSADVTTTFEPIARDAT